MDIRFDAAAAEQLIRQMDDYCREIQKETKDLLAILKTTEQWRDYQKKAFETNIISLAGDLNKALSLEGDYMQMYYQRVQELRG